MENTDYKKWRQDDPEYNQTVAWPEFEYPDAKLHSFAECGCLVTALAIMLRKHNRIPKDEIQEFTPRTFCDRLKIFKVFDSAGNLCSFLPIEYLYRIKYVGSQDYSYETLKTDASDGMVLLKVKGNNAPFHFICLDKLTSNDAVIIDSASDKSHLSEFDEVYEILKFIK